MSGSAGPADRAGTDLTELLTHVADAFKLGGVRDWSVLTTGYEDCNVKVTTSDTRLVVKVVAADRAADLAGRTTDLITRAQAAGVHHPRLHHDRRGELVHHHRGHQMMVMDFVPGHTLYDLDRAPNHAELTRILEQVVRIHAIDAHPAFVFDPWAITNLVPLTAQLRGVLDTEQRRLVTRAVEETAGVDRDALPATLIHADLTKGNVLLTEQGTVTMLDFAVANRFPRVQELAVIAANLTHGSTDPLPARVESIATLYSSAAPVPLSTAEMAALRAFTHAAAAMELLGALAQWHCHRNHNPETAYLIELGLAGLRDYGAVS